MTLRYLLDTSIVFAPMTKTPPPQIIKRLEVHGHESAIAAPVWHELTYGCRRLPRGKRRDALDSYLHEVVQASCRFTPTIAEWCKLSNLDGVVSQAEDTERRCETPLKLHRTLSQRT